MYWEHFPQSLSAISRSENNSPPERNLDCRLLLINASCYLEIKIKLFAADYTNSREFLLLFAKICEIRGWLFFFYMLSCGWQRGLITTITEAPFRYRDIHVARTFQANRFLQHKCCGTNRPLKHGYSKAGRSYQANLQNHPLRLITARGDFIFCVLSISG